MEDESETELVDNRRDNVFSTLGATSMNKFSKLVFAAALLALAAGTAVATPVPNSNAFFTRVFNDTPFSVLTTTDNYPALVQIADQSVAPAGWANLHTWRFSQDGSTAMEV